MSDLSYSSWTVGVKMVMKIRLMIFREMEIHKRTGECVFEGVFVVLLFLFPVLASLVVGLGGIQMNSIEEIFLIVCLCFTRKKVSRIGMF